MGFSISVICGGSWVVWAVPKSWLGAVTLILVHTLLCTNLPLTIKSINLILTPHISMKQIQGSKYKIGYKCKNYVTTQSIGPMYLQHISILKVHIAIVTQCTKLCKQLSKGFLNKTVFRPFLQCPETRYDLRCNGSEFHSDGPVHAKAQWSTCSRLILGMTTRAWSAKCRLQCCYTIIKIAWPVSMHSAMTC